MSKNCSKFKDALIVIFMGICTVLAFEPYRLFPLSLAIALLSPFVLLRPRSVRHSIALGFLLSIVVVCGGFYWVTHVMQEFGHLSFLASCVLLFGFCFIGALHFPIYFGVAQYLQNKIIWKNKTSKFTGFWFAVFLPSIYTWLDFTTPKLFPWSLSHCLYKQPLLTQIADITGASGLTFALTSFASTLGLLLFHHKKVTQRPVQFFLFPAMLWIGIIFYGVQSIHNEKTKRSKFDFPVAIAQANIGTIDKVASEKGSLDKVFYVLNQYLSLSEKSLEQTPKPKLIIWPETAVPFDVAGEFPLAENLRAKLYGWGIPSIIGGYDKDPVSRLDYNAAFLFERFNQKDSLDIYRKTQLLAFGEYMPFGEMFPVLYRWFPEVSHFGKGNKFNIFQLRSGLRIGTTICYEAIDPEFTRQISKQGVHLLVNLTNDSWFGDTSEPDLHASLTTFRAIEARVPIVRATNTGISMFINSIGEITVASGKFKPELLTSTIQIPTQLKTTFYLMYGNWFVLICGLIALLGYVKIFVLARF